MRILLAILSLAYKMSSFLEIDPNSDFSLHNIPFGVFSLNKDPSQPPRCATRIGDLVIDLSYLEKSHFLKFPSAHPVFDKPDLNSFIALGKSVWDSTRETIKQLFATGSPHECALTSPTSDYIHSIVDCKMHLPVSIGDYTDFYSSRQHAYNVGVMFRGVENALQPNWLWMPIAYHDRSSSVVVSPTSFNRPSGQIKGPNDAQPRFAKSQKMDFELEVGMIIGKSNPLGTPIDINHSQDHIFGFVLLNDVSVRDVQNWEYVPLGPFTGKNCITVISPWIVQTEALRKSFVKLPPQDPQPLDYLKDSNYGAFDVKLDVSLMTPQSNKEQLISSSNMKHLICTCAAAVRETLLEVQHLLVPWQG